MSTTDVIDKYLGANRPDIAGLNVFNAMADPQELQKRFAEGVALRKQLVQQGPAIILPMLRAAPPQMRDASALATSFMAQLNPQGYTKLAEGTTEAIFRNAQDVVTEMGKPATEPLLQALKERDADVRALAAAFLGVRSVSGSHVVAPLRTAFFQDEDIVVKLAAAITLIGCGYADHKTVDAARELMGAVLDQAMPRWFKLSADPVQLCIRLLPQLIGQRGKA